MMLRSVLFLCTLWTAQPLPYYILTNQISWSHHLHDTESLVTERGYPFEAHNVTTSDGFVLQIHRIPYSPFQSRQATIRPPVYLQHGLLASSADWVIIGRNKSLAFLLSDLGYDVWMGNIRGNHYSRRHVKLDPTDPAFWRFSWDEMAEFDLPATIDYIRDNTGFEQLFYVGHSMGTTMYFAMANSQPEYQKYVRLMTALAPVAYVGHIKSPFVRFMSLFTSSLEDILLYLGHGELSTDHEPFRLLVKYFCDWNKIEELVCSNLLFLFAGYDYHEFDPDILPTILNNTPAGTSVYTLAHYGQMYKSNKFCYFDYGKKGNEQKYNSSTPPDYSLRNINTKVAMHYSLNDWLAVPEDVSRAIDELGSQVVRKKIVPFDKFNHLDFLWANDVKTLLYDDVIRLIIKYTPGMK